MKSLIVVFGVVAVVYVAVAALLFIYQRGFLYFPSPKIDHGLPIEQFSAQGELIDVVVVNAKNPQSNKAILYFGGNAEAVVHNASQFALALPDYTFYLVNYRGYGGSSGEPTEKGIYADALFIYDSIKQRHDDLFVIGRSLGSGVATFLAAKRGVAKIALVTPYDSILNVAQARFRLFPLSILLKDKYDSVGRAGEVDSDVLVLLAEHDAVIPLKHSVRLIEAFSPQQVKVKTLLGVGHNDLSDADEYCVFLRDYF